VRTDLDRAYNEYIATQRENPEKLDSERANVVHLTILHQLIDQEILDQRAAKLQPVASDEDVNGKLIELKAPYTQEEFEKNLKQQKMTLEDLKQQIRRHLTSDKLINKEIESKITISDADINNFYNEHRSEFNLIEPQYRLAWIVVSADGGQPGKQDNAISSDADARKKVETIRDLLTTAVDFGSLAKSFSEDPNTNSIAGDLGFIPESQLQQRDPAAFASIGKLKVGQVTDVLPYYSGAGPNQHATGYAIYKIIAREPAGQRELNNPSVQQTIRQGLRESRAQLLTQAYNEILRDDAKIRNYFAEQVLNQGSK
jgi:peptidyl-prolyl cis-trans isomerase SurA